MGTPSLGLKTRRVLKKPGVCFPAGKGLLPWLESREEVLLVGSSTASRCNGQTHASCFCLSSLDDGASFHLGSDPRTRGKLFITLPFPAAAWGRVFSHAISSGEQIQMYYYFFVCLFVCLGNSLLPAHFSPGVKTPCSPCKWEHVRAHLLPFRSGGGKVLNVS